MGIIRSTSDTERRQYRVGTKVLSKHGPAKIVGINLMDEVGTNAFKVPKIWVDLKDRCIFDLDNGHWAYGDSVFADE